MQLSEDEGTLLEEMNSVESKGLPPILPWDPPFKLPLFTQRVSRVISYILLPPVWCLLGCQEPSLEGL